MKRLSIISVVFAFAMACGGKKDDKPAPAPVATGSAAVVTPATNGSAAVAAGSAAAEVGSAMAAGSAAVAAGLEPPTEVDFEAEANARITEKNVDLELKAIEKELAQQ